MSTSTSISIAEYRRIVGTSLIQGDFRRKGVDRQAILRKIGMRSETILKSGRKSGLKSTASR